MCWEGGGGGEWVSVELCRALLIMVDIVTISKTSEPVWGWAGRVNRGLFQLSGKCFNPLASTHTQKTSWCETGHS